MRVRTILAVILCLAGCAGDHDSSAVDTAKLQPPPTVTTDTTSPDTTAPRSPQTVLRDYYEAINHRDFATAWRLWEGDGEASGKSLVDFSTGFQGTREVDVKFGDVPPPRTEGSWLSVSVPVSISAEMKTDDKVEYEGTYVLRKPAASSSEEDWRIQEADLRALAPVLVASDSTASRN